MRSCSFRGSQSAQIGHPSQSTDFDFESTPDEVPTSVPKHVLINYPAEEEHAWDDVVTHITRSTAGIDRAKIGHWRWPMQPIGRSSQSAYLLHECVRNQLRLLNQAALSLVAHEWRKLQCLVTSFISMREPKDRRPAWRTVPDGWGSMSPSRAADARRPQKSCGAFPQHLCLPLR